MLSKLSTYGNKKKLLIRKCPVSKLIVFIVFELAIRQLKLPAKCKQRYTNKVMKKAKYI